MKSKILFIIALNFVVSCSSPEHKKAMIIESQGSFAIGGTVIEKSGQTLHGDHSYVFYQKPVNAHKNALVFLHGFGQSAKTWESTPDGREGYQNLFLKKGYSVYLLDQPRRGKAGRSTVPLNIEATPDDQQWFNIFRVGIYPDYFPGVQFSQDKNTIDQYFRQMTPNTGAFDSGIISDSISALFDKIGPGVLVTHSQGGGPGWQSVMKNKKITGVIAYEPGSGFAFPVGEVPPLMTSAGGSKLAAESVAMDEFLKLTKIPIVIYYGDNIPAQPSKNAGQDQWRIRLDMARLWAAAVNRHGGDVTVVHLPEVGLKGNTHFPFSDLNNVEVAAIMQKFLQQKNLE